MNKNDNPFKQAAIVYCIELQTNYAYIELFIEFLETICTSISYFEAYDNKTIDSRPEDLWQIDAYLEEEPDYAYITQKIAEISSHHDIAMPMVTIEPVDEIDWVSEVQKSFVPIHAGRFFIHDSVFADKKPENSINIEINAGRAFGTGEHETTSNCLKTLSELSGATFNVIPDEDEVFDRGSCEDKLLRSPVAPLCGLPGMTQNVLDMGCGSGILAIAMAKMGMERVIAADLDEQAVLVTQENAKLNNVKLLVEQSNGYKSIFIAEHAPYQLITANILATPLIEMANDASQHLAKNGILILAGFLKDQLASVLAAHQQQGLTLVKEICAENWPVLVMKKS